MRGGVCLLTVSTIKAAQCTRDTTPTAVSARLSSKGSRGISDVSPFLYISSLVLLPSLVALSVLFFSAFGPFACDLFFPKPPFSKRYTLLCGSWLFVCLSGWEMSTLVGGMCSIIMLPYGTGISLYAFI